MQTDIFLVEYSGKQTDVQLGKALPYLSNCFAGTAIARYIHCVMQWFHLNHYFNIMN